MMAAAQAAAEAALQEALALDTQQSNSLYEQEEAANRPLEDESVRLMKELQSEHGVSEEQQVNLLRQVLDLQASNAEDPAAAEQQLFQLLARQQQNESRFAASAAEAVQQVTRPQQHYLTIAHNGTILEATKTVTGFPPDALLMTSAYDAVYEEDLPGFLFVKTHFWDKKQTGVEVFLRRRTIEGDWIWLISRAVTHVDAPIPGIILLESQVQDESAAKRHNRVTRIVAILVQAVEAALLTQQSKSQNNEASSRNGEAAAAAPGHMTNMTEDAVAYQSLLESMPANVPGTEESLKSLLEIAASGGSLDVRTSNAETRPEQELIENAAVVQKKPFDPWSIIESVRQGVRLDLGLTRLYPEEVKLIALVMSGTLHVNEVAPRILAALQIGQSLTTVTRDFRLDCEKSSSHNRKLSPPSHVLSPPSSSSSSSPELSFPPPISVVNLSYTYIGNTGIEMLSQIIYTEKTAVTALDLSFCEIEEKGLLALARALAKRKRRGIAPLQGLIISGNYISIKAATELGCALSPSERAGKRGRKRSRTMISTTGYDSEDSDDEEDEEDDGDDEDFPSWTKKTRAKTKPREGVDGKKPLQVLHVANASMTAEAISRLLEGLGPDSLIRELNLSSNNFGPEGASVLVRFLESRQRSRKSTPMPLLDRLDMSNNNLGDDGTTQLTRAISKRAQVHLVDLKLSSNSIGVGGIETIMNKLLQHNLISLSLDKNSLGDTGCQLVAASLHTMPALSRLNLSFNQIGSRGINSLMRSLISCDSITYLGLSGNILRISGAMALAFTLAQHPRLEELDLDNCCLGQAAQCHIAAGIISNRWVPMKRLKGYAVGPPMVAIGALKPYAQNLGNEECFRIRKDEQMKTLLQWMESNRIAKKRGAPPFDPNIAAAMEADNQNRKFLTPDFVSTINDIHGTPSQNAYFRLLGWLSRIPFDDDELSALQKYFYDPDGGEGDRGSDGYINLKLRGDLLAALDSEVADEIRDELPSLASRLKGSVGLDLDKLYSSHWDAWKAFKGLISDPPPSIGSEEDETRNDTSDEKEPRSEDAKMVQEESSNDLADDKAASMASLSHAKPEISASQSSVSTSGREKKSGKKKARITMFPQFEKQLEDLKAAATEMIEQEEDTMQHEVILTQYAEMSLTILRQLRYHCMNSGLDGWRQAGLKRKVLIIDDSAVTRKLVFRAFEKANFIVDTAANGAEGVEKLKASIYDIAFMDIEMPVMNGFEATKKLREWEDKMRPGARQPICALTATYVDDFERSELMKFKDAGLDVMESKPCNITRLLKVVDDVSPMFSDLHVSVIQKKRSSSSILSSSE